VDHHQHSSGPKEPTECLAQAEQGDLNAMRCWADWLSQHSRPEEAGIWNSAVSTNDAWQGSAYSRLGEHLLAQRRPRGTVCLWLRRAADAGFTAFGPVLEDHLYELVAAGMPEQALPWLTESGLYKKEAEAVLWIAWTCDRFRLAETKAWYDKYHSLITREDQRIIGYPAMFGAEQERLRDAARAGDTFSMTTLALDLDRRGRSHEATQWYRAAAEAGHEDAFLPLGNLLVRLGHLDEAVHWYMREEQRPKPPAAPGWEVITTALITAAMVPFLQALATKAAEDSYNAVRVLLSRIARRHGAKARRQADQAGTGTGVLLIVGDPKRNLTLRIRTDATDEALRALAKLDLSSTTPDSQTERSSPLRLEWNPDTHSWRIEG